MSERKFTQGDLFRQAAGRATAPSPCQNYTDEAERRLIVSLYEAGLKYREIVAQTGRPTNTILDVVKASGVPMRGSGNRTRTVDHAFFSDPPGEVRDYVIGLIATDGCVTENSRVAITLQGATGHYWSASVTPLPAPIRFMIVPASRTTARPSPAAPCASIPRG